MSALSRARAQQVIERMREMRVQRACARACIISLATTFVQETEQWNPSDSDRFEDILADALDAAIMQALTSLNEHEGKILPVRLMLPESTR